MMNISNHSVLNLFIFYRCAPASSLRLPLAFTSVNIPLKHWTKCPCKANRSVFINDIGSYWGIKMMGAFFFLKCSAVTALRLYR